MDKLWQLLAGLGVFIYGMLQLEDALKQLAGRTFKLFLKKHTDRKLSAVFSGTLVTGVLQSSSVVTLIVLGFVGTGILSMRNALAVVFGSNLGTTLDSWVVATLGFKFNIEQFSLPVIAIAAAGLIGFPNYKKIQQVSKFFMGFGLLFLGLSLMKESMGSFAKNLDITRYSEIGNLGFVFIGFIITAIIQSSSATMVVVLSALNTGAIPFDSAVAVVIGSELGTSIKIVLGAIGGVAEKKQVAFGNLIFNFSITLFAYSLMYPIIWLIKNAIGIADPLLALVMFQTLINLSGIILFLPFLDRFTGFLKKLFLKKENNATYFITNDNSPASETMIETLEKETALFIYRVINLNIKAFRINDLSHKYEDYLKSVIEVNGKQFNSASDKYDDVKRAEGEILSFYNKIHGEKIEKNDFIRLNQLTSAVRNAMYAAKGIKDLSQDRSELRNTANDIKFEQYQVLQLQLENFYTHVGDILTIKDQSFRFKQLVELMGLIRKDYETRMKGIYKQSAKKTMEELDISTLLNVNREIYSSCKAIVYSLKEYLLDTAEAEKFESTPMSTIK